MWHLLLILIALICNIRLWIQQNPLFTALLLHAVFLSACCMRYVTLVTLQVRKQHASVMFRTPHPLPTKVLRNFTKGEREPLTEQNKIIKPNRKINATVNQKRNKKPTHPECFSKKKVSNGFEVSLPKKEQKKGFPKKLDKPIAKKQQPPEPKKVEKQAEVQQKLIPIEKQESLTQEKTPEQTGPLEFQITNKADAVIQGSAQLDPHAVLYARILEEWKPPCGVKVRLPCVIRAFIGKGILEGKPEVVSSSGSNAFDMAARRVLLSIAYPQEMWNRAIMIHFS